VFGEVTPQALLDGASTLGFGNIAADAHHKSTGLRAAPMKGEDHFCIG
jgi:hypothetical protein